MATVYIDGKPYEVDPEQNLLQTALSLGLDLPYFCWHPALGSVGACRQCGVKQFKDENDPRGRIVMACMTPARDGTRISINDPEAVAFRAASTEWLMTNHPHDCPVCDEGGECHLQDMTVMTGHVYRRYRFDKRTHQNQYLGPFVNHEMNRCIECYRCVRFYRDYAAGRDFDVFAAHDNVYFGRSAEGVLESEFSGNLVEVCPTGVFTDKTLKKHYTRKWDLQTAPSICVHCSLGCNTIPGERYGMLRRIRNRYNHEVNGYFLCDRGRYGYDFVNSNERIRKPMIKSASNGSLESTDEQGALQRLSEILKSGSTLIGIGSPRASLEANFALKCLVGENHFFAGISAAEALLTDTALKILQEGAVPTASLHDVEMSDAVVVLGEDLNNIAPMLALALRQSIRNQPMELARQAKIDKWDDASLREFTQSNKGPLYLATPAATRLDDAAMRVIRLAPEDIARLGFQAAHLVDAKAPAVKDLREESQSLARMMADDLMAAKRPLVITGTTLGSLATIQAAANLAQALKAAGKEVRIVYTFPECNSLGLAMLTHQGLDQALKEIERKQGATVVILENDLYRRSEAPVIDKLLASAGSVIAIDHLSNGTIAKADVVLPAATFAEGDGTLVNNEGRAQRFFQVMSPVENIRESWRWVTELMQMARHGLSGKWQVLDDVIASLSTSQARFAPISRLAPPASFRINGQRVPRQPHRYSGRTSMNAAVNVNEPKPPDDPDTPMSFSMEGFKGQPPAALVTHYWAPGWNSVQSLNKFQQEVGGLMKEDEPGERLLQPGNSSEFDYFKEIPESYSSRGDQYLVVPVHFIYGSEELSRLAPAVAELTPVAALAANAETAAHIKMNAGQTVQIKLHGATYEMPLRILESLPTGVVGLPAGYPGIPSIFPAWGELLYNSPAGGTK